MNIISKKMIEEYVNNEINFINKYEDTTSKGTIADLNVLHNLSDADMQAIADAINNDDELCETINELIHNYLYE